MFKILCEKIAFQPTWNVLDVGVTSDQAQISSNYFEEFYPHKNQITALSNQNAEWLEKKYPGLTFVQGSGVDLPFTDNKFDVVFSSAVIEHVGSYNNQMAFIAQCYRVARRHVFLTTPNRWHPIEFHTVLPFIHWLPKKIHRHILKLFKLDYLATEANLNLLSHKDLIKLCHDIGITNYKIYSVSLLGFPSNLMLHITK
ncbi:SAM-dependent methyltransferase [Deltaproteobacteria bacterium Smac51]|nr:SAM-dependent methyltransferase [Deltaproteobacteria bacterium Smac51]